MKIMLNEQEVMRAIETYMLLRGYQIGSDFTFSWERSLGALKSVEFGVSPLKVDVEKIKKHANKR